MIKNLDILPSWIVLPALVLFYRPVIRFFPNTDRDQYVRRVVAVGNRYFSKRFDAIPYSERVLFLPYCLRSEGCPTIIDPENGLLCPRECELSCRIKEMRNLALELGYADVFVVVSGKLHKKEGALRSRDFLVRQIEKKKPRAVIGCLCTKDLREKYLSHKNVSPKGTLGQHGVSVIPQVQLLKSSNCRRSDVDWEGLLSIIRSRA
jgi:hypothetical protein